MEEKAKPDNFESISNRFLDPKFFYREKIDGLLDAFDRRRVLSWDI